MEAELILILVFAALSLLGAVADKAKKGGAPAPPPPPIAQRLPDGSVRLASGETVAAGTPEAEAFWWLPAPASPEESSSETEDLEDGVISMEPVTQADDRSLEPVGSATWDRGVRGERPEPVRGTLEATEVDWNAEHQRFHERYVDGAQPTAAHARSSILAGIRGRHGLRQAVLAAEILGPPRALRPPDER